MISVVMPVYNCEAYIKEAVDSILNQTFTNFEFLIIDDCSSDTTVKIIKKYTDSRIKIITKEVNKGISDSLNYGISIAKGKYIARMDGDDVSLPKRFERQVNFLESNQNITVCGTAFKILGGEREVYFPKESEGIKIAMLKRNAIAHPSVMMRKINLLKQDVIYDHKMEPAEDYDLWVRLLKTEKLYNINEILLYYRSHDNQVTETNVAHRLEKAFKSKFKLLTYLNGSFDESEKKLYYKVIEDPKNINFEELKKFIYFKNKLLKLNTINFFNNRLFADFLQFIENENFKNYFLRRKVFLPSIFFQYYIIKNKSSYTIKKKDQLKLLIKSLFFYRK